MGFMSGGSAGRAGVDARPAPGTALFAWVKQSLLEAVTRGEFSADEPFATQRQIVEQFGVSTTTAVRALNELVADGVVERRRGQGTFVIRRPPGGSERSAGPVPGGSATGGGGQRTVVYVRPDDGGAYAAQLLSGLVTESSAAGCQLAVVHTRGPDEEERQLTEAVRAGADAVIRSLTTAQASGGPSRCSCCAGSPWCWWTATYPGCRLTRWSSTTSPSGTRSRRHWWGEATPR